MWKEERHVGHCLLEWRFGFILEAFEQLNPSQNSDLFVLAFSFPFSFSIFFSAPDFSNAFCFLVCPFLCALCCPSLVHEF